MCLQREIKFATKALLLHKGKFLALHKRGMDENLWELPGGTIEFGEYPEEVVVRKVKQDTNLSIEPMKLLDTWTFIRGDNQVVGVIYLCGLRNGQLVLSEEYDMYKWIPADRLSLEDMHPAFKERMEKWNWRDIL